MPALRGHPLFMPLAVVVLFFVLGFPAAVVGLLWLRLKAKEKERDEYLREVTEHMTALGIQPLGYGKFRWDGRAFKVEASTNPLLSSKFSVRVAAFSGTIHEFELKRGRPVPEEFKRFEPLLGRWESAGKMFVECYAAGVTDDSHLSSDARALLELAQVPMSKTWRGGTFTYREGFEPGVPQWHWRHDQRPKLPKDVKRWCFSYWQDSPLLNPVVMRVLWELAGENRKFFLSDTEDLSMLEYGFERRDIACWGTLVELKKPELPVAADLHTDGGFFGGLLAAHDLPPGYEEQMPKVRFHDAAIKSLRKCDFYARRLFDDECSWYSGEYEIVSMLPLDVRGVISRIAGEMGAQVMDIDRRFHKRLVKPLEY